MSLILDALNRSQTERGSEGDVPGIETRHWVEPLPYAGRWQRGLPWLALGLALLVIVWLLFSRNSGPEEVSAKVSAPLAAPVEVRSNPTQAKLVESELSKGPPLKKETAASPQTRAAAPVDDLAAIHLDRRHGHLHGIGPRHAHPRRHRLPQRTHFDRQHFRHAIGPCRCIPFGEL